jgi:predicted transcriptional regulator of viral defense system
MRHRTQALIRELSNNGRRCFSSDEVRRWIYGQDSGVLAQRRSHALLHRLVASGLLERVAHGLYFSPLAGGSPDEWEIAMLLDDEAVLSHRSAMVAHGLTEQLPLVVNLTVPGGPHEKRPARQIGKIRYDFTVAAPSRFFGHENRWMGPTPVRVTDLERTLLDGLMSPDRCGGFEAVVDAFAMTAGRINTQRYLEYVERLGLKSVAQRSGFLGQVTHWVPATEDRLRELSGTRTALLNADGRDEGETDRAWHVRINDPLPVDV